MEKLKKRIYECRLARTRNFAVAEDLGEYGKLDASDRVASVMRQLNGDSPREAFYVFAVDARLNVIAVECIAVGDCTSVAVPPAEVFRSVLASGAQHFIVSHNHPSGSLEPSDQDRAITARLSEGSKILGLAMLDHVIVTDTSSYSFANRGAL